MSFKKSAALFVCLALTAVALGGCSSDDNGTGATADATENAVNEDMFTDRDLNSDYDKNSPKIILADSESASDSKAVSISGDEITITDEGAYIVSGALSDGSIIIDADKTDKIQLVLDGVSVSRSQSAALYIKQADKVFVTLAQDSENSLLSTSELVQSDDNNVDGAVFSKDDLTFNGGGSLEISCESGHGIVSKDDLVFTGGSYKVTCASQALSGKDSIRVSGGSFALNSGKDGLHSENTDDTAKGFVYISGGEFDITSDGDGIDASAYTRIDGGNFNIESGGGYENAEAKQPEMFGFDRGAQQHSSQEEELTSAKGIKASGDMTINGGTFVINSADDALHSNASLLIADGNITAKTGDDGIHADSDLTISGGTVEITESYEGIEGQSISVSGGEISVVADDDGFNASGGNDESGFGGGMRMDSFESNGDCFIKISGGTIKVNAEGDGVDSNGSLYVSGGETYVAGPTNSGNGALDYNGEAEISGGVFVAAGASGMAQNFGTASTQCSMLVTFSAISQGDTITLCDSSGGELISCTAEKSCNSVLISTPEITQGETYTVNAGAQSAEVEMTSTIYSSQGTGMQGGGMGGKGGGMNGHGFAP